MSGPQPPGRRSVRRSGPTPQRTAAPATMRQPTLSPSKPRASPLAWRWNWARMGQAAPTKRSSWPPSWWPTPPRSRSRPRSLAVRQPSQRSIWRMPEWKMLVVGADQPPQPCCPPRRPRRPRRGKSGCRWQARCHRAIRWTRIFRRFPIRQVGQECDASTIAR